MLDNTRLFLLHPSIGRLQSLKILSVKNNRLYDLPLTIRLLRNLECLDITGNNFRSLPGAVFHLYQLKVIEGLQNCLLQTHSRWTEYNRHIVSIPPLKHFARVARDKVDLLQDIALHNAIGMNCWLIPLPERYRSMLVERAITHDLCENCLKPVKRLMSDQESDG